MPFNLEDFPLRTSTTQTCKRKYHITCFQKGKVSILANEQELEDEVVVPRTKSKFPATEVTCSNMVCGGINALT